jgi:hypothetical protein
MNLQQRKTILILSANPKDTRRLRDDEEIRTIKEILQHSKYHENFKVETELATPVADLQSTLLRHSPHIVHFCGHGEADGLLFEDETGKKQQVPVDDLAELFAICIQECEKPIECLVLNACYSKTQAEAMHQHIPYVIGMNTNIGDKAAIRFAEGFYTGLGEGYSYPTAFKLGCNNIGLHNIPEGSIPVILEQQNTTPLQAEEVDYEWDVFLSYEPVRVFNEWREEIFLEPFEEFLRQYLLRPVKIFERKKLYAGEDIPVSVKNALARSRCFVALCSPTYFNCYQCRYELSVMLRRERRFGYRTADNPNPLILIANVFDGEKFPVPVSRLMRREWDFNGLTSLGIRFGRKSHLLEEKILALAKATEQAINAPPVWENSLFDDLTPDEQIILDLHPSGGFPLPRH